MPVDMDKMREARRNSRRPKRKEWSESDTIGHAREPTEDNEMIHYKEILHISDDAALFLLESGKKQWIPKGEIMDAANNAVEVTTWWINKAGFSET